MSAFVKTLSDCQKGAVLGELDESLSKLVAAIREHGGAGQIGLVLKIKSMNENMVSVTGDVTVKVPKATKTFSFFYVTEDDLLSRDNPNQSELNFREIEGGKKDENADATAAN